MKNKNNSEATFKNLLSQPFTVMGKLSESRGWAYYLIAPSLILILLIIIYPLLTGISLSFQEMRLTRPDKNGFVGLAQYADVFQDDVFWGAFKNTAIWVVVGAVSQFILGLCTALALNQSGQVTKIIGIIVLLPWILPSVVAANLWALLLDPRLGVINDILVKLGMLDQYHAWFADPDTAMPAAMVVSLWRGFPFFSLLLLAGLQGISTDLYEAAAVDGASRWDRFRYIMMPMLKPIIIASMILKVIGLVNSPDVLLILTNGGPGHVTQVLSLYAFQTAYSEFDFGYAGALSVIMFAILMLFTVLYVRASGGVTEE